MGYSDANTVACCTVCNSMKASLPIHEFVRHVRKICAYSCEGIIAKALDCTKTNIFAGTNELRTLKKDKTDILSMEERIQLWTSPCYLCGQTYAMGIDRNDSSKGYTPTNVQSCCRLCNYMKKHLTADDMKPHLLTICSNLSNYSDDQKIPFRLYDNVSGDLVQPVGAWKGSKLTIAFPSVSCRAAMVVGLKSKLKNSVDEQGFHWRHISIEEHMNFRNENMTETLKAFWNCKKHY